MPHTVHTAGLSDPGFEIRQSERERERDRELERERASRIKVLG